MARYNSLPDGSSAKARAYLAFGPLRQLEDSLSQQKYSLYSRLDFLLSTAEFENDIAVPPDIDQPSPDDFEIDDPPPLPLTIWALNHEIDSNTILDLCTPSLHTLDKDAGIVLPVSAVNCEFPPTSTSALSIDNDKHSSYTFTIRTVLDGQNCFTIHTNSPLLFTADPFQFTSDRPSPNFKFILSKFLTFFFYRQSRIPSRTWRKYFNCLRQLLLTQHVTSLARWTSSHRNNRCTHTFIQFRYQRSCFYLGVYYGCPFCKLPAAYVMLNFRHACHIHDRKLIQTPSPPPTPPFTLPCNRVSQRQENGYFKELTSRRLGVSYRKSYAFHAVLQDANNQQLAARTLVSYSAHSSISHPTKKQLARQQ
ncbi:hypothetical protein C1646_775977 [Rhizophagus diaphanus]|nr:hypothetical protein C1646_775977 [Rhizophagus diaphanus] [Rhizophagus sp. MUCL 43196]